MRINLVVKQTANFLRRKSNKSVTFLYIFHVVLVQILYFVERDA